MTDKFALVVANGEVSTEFWLQQVLGSADFVVACDGGANHLHSLGIIPDLFVGDSDSVSEESREWLRSNQVKLELSSVEKDETDLELALLSLVGKGHSRIDVVAALGQRVDHELANLMLLTDSRFDGLDIRVVSESQQIRVVRQSAGFDRIDGEILSLIPVHGEAIFKSTQGLKWELNNDSLLPGPARGVSNELVADAATIELESGIVLAIQTSSL